MNIVSIEMLGWIIIFVSITWLFPLKTQPFIIITLSSIFLFIYSPISFFLLTFLSLMVYLLIMQKVKYDFLPLLITIIAVLSIIIFFKLHYKIEDSESSSIIIPLGISYYSLRLIHFHTDYWKGIIKNITIIQFFTYIFFLPTLLAGPINRFQNFQRSFQRRRWDSHSFSIGLERILYGYAKIIIIGNYLINKKMLNFINNSLSNYPILSEYFDSLQYGLNLYFQFSGYSDIAIGFALLLNFSIEENFNYPFLAININEFWKRWHITLSNWCRDYIYIGVWSIKRNSGLAIILSMLVLGLWHELSFRYILWGGYHAIGIVLWQIFQKIKPNKIKTNKFTNFIFIGISWFITMNFVILSFVITKEPDIKSAFNVYFTIFQIGV